MSESTLKIRNFPPCLADNEKEDFLRHFGAVEVKIIPSKINRKSAALAMFESNAMARSVLHRLHQLRLLDSLLVVEYATNNLESSSTKDPTGPETEEYKNKRHYKSFITKINAFNGSVNFNQPPPHHLRYSYPKPNRATINNIARALASVPKFYTQVLHLMNRMNLPPPFSNVPDPPMVPQASPVKLPEKDKELSESEIESDAEIDALKNIAPLKRTLPQKRKIKRPKFIRPNVTQPSQSVKEKPEDVFDTVELQNRRIELRVNAECLDNKIEETDVKKMDDEEDESNETPQADCISEEELNSNRIPAKDLNVLPVFKDYHPGIPSSRLYIKNIAKTVEKSDLEYVFKRYRVADGDGGAPHVFDIRLMQEGRMKGQAFVTLDCTEIAQKALKETNGFILKDKPLVVVFARTSVAKK